MATLEKRLNRYRVVLRLNGKKISRSIKSNNEVEAQAALARIRDGLRRMELGLLAPPDGADVITFLFSDGHVTGKPEAPQLRSLRQLSDAFFDSIIEGSMEQATLSCMKTHLSHFKRILGGRFLFAEIQQQDLQRYATQRLKERGRRGAQVSPVTVRKELSSLRTIWNWAIEQGHVRKKLPLRGLKLPKTVAKRPFLAFSEVSRRVARGGFTEQQKASLWDSVFLPLPDLKKLLAHVKAAPLEPVVYPMVAFAAFTGARRSEIIRSQLDDLDFESKTAILHERKRVPGEITTRRVPLVQELIDALNQWLDSHPGGPHTFALPPIGFARDDIQSLPVPLTPRQMHRRFRFAVDGTEWENLRGWHVFRHSFCSNCAARGVDERIIASWVGHQTKVMVDRYRHLVPTQEQHAIRHVFG